MTIEVKSSSGYSMALHEEKGRLYLGSGRMHILSFPAMEKVARLDRVCHSRPILSKDGRYVAFYNAVGFLDVHTTTEPMRRIIHKNWKTSTSPECAAFYRDGEALLVAVDKKLYAFWGEDLAQETLLCGGGEANWNSETVDASAHISCISICNGEILVTYYSHADVQLNFVVKFRHLQDREPLVVMWPFSLRWYNCALFDQRGGVALFKHIGNEPMLWYDTFPKDFGDVKKTIQLPGSGWPHFADDGKYLAAISSGYEKDGFVYAWLWDTAHWTEIHCIKDGRLITDTSFSLQNHYWLVGGERPLLIPIT